MIQRARKQREKSKIFLTSVTREVSGGNFSSCQTDRQTQKER